MPRWLDNACGDPGKRMVLIVPLPRPGKAMMGVCSGYSPARSFAEAGPFFPVPAGDLPVPSRGGLFIVPTTDTGPPVSQGQDGRGCKECQNGQGR